VTDFSPKELLDDSNDAVLDEYDVGDVFTGLEERFQVSDAVQISGKNRVLLACIFVSLLLHFGLVFAIPRLAGFPRADSVLKPGEKATQVRLVEPQPTEPTPAPPQENASAISDRNHFTQKERIPKVPPAPLAPLGSPEPIQRHMASLSPPSAPEDFIEEKEAPKPQEETAKEEEKPTPAVQQPQQKNGRTKSKESVEPRPSKKKPQRRVDLRPTPEEVQTGISGPGGGADFYPDGVVDEAVVDINTREDRYFSYLLHLKRKIQGVWVYPSAAAKSGIGGMLTIEFSIAKNGELVYVNLLDSSGHAILDESAKTAVKTAAPYHPLPESMKAKRLRIRANFIYVTQNYFRNIL
jgi:protein TonB